MKRIVFFLCTLLCANVLMAQTRFLVGDLQYEVTSTNPAEVKVYNANESITTANIPSTVTYQETTYDVTSIGYEAFYECSSLTTVTIPNSVTSIGDYAFSGCSALTSVTIGNSVTSIEGGAFKYCSSLTSVTIPNSVTYIGESAFYNCSSLTSVAIPNSVTFIGYEAFRGCSSLTSVTIPNSVTSIAGGAFKGCSSLQNVTCLATTPPTLADNPVFPNPNTATLTVPCGTFEVYNSSDWNIFFADRIEEDCEDNTGLEDAEFAELSVYPNPTRGKVSFNQAIEKIEVIDLSGKTLQTYENANEINIEALPAGVYHLRMTIGDKTTTRKVIKD